MYCWTLVECHVLLKIHILLQFLKPKNLIRWETIESQLSSEWLKWNHCTPPYERQIWFGFDRASSLICGNKMPARNNRWFLLQILLLTQHVSGGHHYAHHQEFESIIQVVAACRIWCLGFQVVGMVACPVCGQQPANRTHNPQLHTIPTTWKPKHQVRQAATTCIILLNSWWWA